ncbi:MAG TPA: prolyl oligopeptidase family serine peptidase, partial [Ignavibacteriaceae bacterium]|nr:prolyl oligopeptidase family serine peptidase [Ignavibacteriaceae bacterium]
MEPKIIERQKINLNDTQTKMLISGWGQEVFDNSIVEKIVYQSDGLKVKGYLAYPMDETKKYPCVIWNRGGAKNSGAIDSFTARGMFGQIASWGFVVFASQYRGNAGGEGKEQLGGEEINDVLNLVTIAKELPFANINKWGIEGWSRGGMMTYLTLQKNHNFKCAILVGAISNFRQHLERNPQSENSYREMIAGEYFDEAIEKRSAINFVDQLPDIPYLIVHGVDDKIVSPLQAIEMSRKMISLK